MPFTENVYAWLLPGQIITQIMIELGGLIGTQRLRLMVKHVCW